MPKFENFEIWVKEMEGQEALVDRFKTEFGENTAISQSAISGWIKRKRVPDGERRNQVRLLGYDGPLDWSGEAVEEGGLAHSRAAYDGDGFQQDAGQGGFGEGDYRTGLAGLQDVSQTLETWDVKAGS